MSMDISAIDPAAGHETPVHAPTIRGAGGGGKGGGGSGATEASDSLRSRQIAKVIDVLCEGPIVGLINGLQSIYLNEVPLQNPDGSTQVSGGPLQNTNGTFNFVDVAAQWRNGTQDQLPLDGVSDVEYETAVGVEVKNGVPIVRTLTNPNLDSLRVTVSVPALTTQDTTNGNITGSSVDITIEVQTNGGGYVNRVNDTIAGKTSSRYQRAYLIKLEGAGPWDVRVTRVTGDATTSAVNNKTFFDSYTGIIGSRLAYPNSVLVGTQIDAAQFTSIPSRAYGIKGLIIRVPTNYDPVARTYGDLWDGTFKLAWSDNPAWCFYDLLTNGRYGLGDFIDPSSIDKWALYAIARYCDQTVPDGYGGFEPRFTCNLYLQTRAEAYSVAQNFASIFRAITFWSAGTIVAMQDRPADASALYTNANVIDGVFSYSGTSIKQRHTVALIGWNDPADFYRQKIEYVQDDEGVRQLGVVQTQLTAFGCTSKGQAHRLGHWLLATEKYATESVAFKAGLDGCALYPGAIIKTSDLNRAGKRMGGRLGPSTASVLTLDADFVLEDGKSYSINVIGSDGSTNACAIVDPVGMNVTTRTVHIMPPLAAAPQTNAIYVIAANDLAAETWRVMGVQESGNYVVDVMAIAHYDGLFDLVDNGARFDLPQVSNIKTAPDSPGSLSAMTSPYIVAGHVAGLRLTLSWASSAGTFRVSWRTASGQQDAREVHQTSVDIDNVDLTTYYFSVVAVSAIGRESVPSVLTYVVSPKTTAPLPLTALSASGDILQIHLAWIYAASVDTKLLEIWGGVSSDQATAVKLAEIAYPTAQWTQQGLGAGVTRSYWARVVDTSGNASAWSGPASATTSTDASDILSYLAGQIGKTELGQDVLKPIEDAETLIGPVLQQIDVLLNGVGQQDQLAATQLTGLIAADNALKAARDTLTSTIGGVAAQVTTEATKRVTATDALASQISSVSATASGNTALILSEQTARANADSALSTLVTTVAATANSNTAAITSEQSARANADSAISTRVDSVAATSNGNTAAIVAEQSARASADGALSTRIDSVVATSNGNTAAIVTEQNARAGADGALSTRIDSVIATANGNAAAIQSEASARASADSALSSSITTVAVTANNASASAQTATSALASTNGQLSAMSTIKTQIATGGRTYLASIGVGVSNSTGIVESQILLSANRVAMIDESSGTLTTPFVIQGGQTFISQALIGTAWITNAKIASAAVGTLNIGGNAVTIPASISGNGGAGPFSGSGSYVMSQVFAATLNVNYTVTTPVIVLVTWQSGAPSDGGNTRVEIRADGNTVLAASDTAPSGITTSHVASAVVNLAAGAHSFTLWFANDWPGGGTWNLGNWSLTVLGAMR
jgi:predicted phage tail protein